MKPSSPAWNLDPARRHAERTLAVPASGRLRLVAVADTHARPHPAALARLEAERPDAILHAGDIGDLRLVDALARLAPTFAVRGNIDGRDGHDLPDGLTLHLERAGERLLTVLLLHVAVRGPRLDAAARRLARDRAADLVVCGHSHVPLLARDGGVAVFNPGSIGPRRFALPITYGVLDLSPAGLTLRHVDCETGQPWRPPAP